MSDILTPPRPDPWATSAPLEAMRDCADARIICLAPSVNLTPMGNTQVPVPYMVTDLGSHPETYTTTVNFTGQKVLLARSHTQHCHGDEAGTGGGVKSGTHGGICEPIGHAPQVRAQGSPVVRASRPVLHEQPQHHGPSPVCENHFQIATAGGQRPAAGLAENRIRFQRRCRGGWVRRYVNDCRADRSGAATGTAAHAAGALAHIAAA
jgi:hypothetical protein